MLATKIETPNKTHLGSRSLMPAKKLILFNGPPRSGKDTAAAHVWTKYIHAMHFKMSQPLKDSVKAFFNLSAADAQVAERNKDLPLDMFFGNTYRDVQISLSEHWGKEQFGIRVFGHLAVRNIRRSPSTLFVCSDTGFVDEIVPLIEFFGGENILLVKLHRQGCNFSNDSRSYINIPNVRTLQLYNNDNIANLYEQLDAVIDAWLTL